MTRSLALLALLVSAQAGAEEGLGWLAKTTPACADGFVASLCKCGGTKVTTGYCSPDGWSPAQIDFTVATPGCYASGTTFGGIPVTITRSGANAATYWDGAAYQTCAADTLRVEAAGLRLERQKIQRYPTPAAPAAGTTSTLGVGTWLFRCTGTGSQDIAAGTATATGWGTSSNGSLVTIVVTGAGTASLSSVTGSLSRCQLEGTGSYETNWIPTAATRGADTASIPAPQSTTAWCVSAYIDPGRTWNGDGAFWRAGAASGANLAWLTQGAGASLAFLVNDGAAATKTRTISMLPAGDTGYGSVPRRLTAINDNGTLSVYVDDVAASGTNAGAGTGVWSSAPSTLYLGLRTSTPDTLDGSARAFGALASADPVACLALTAPVTSRRFAAPGDSLTWGAHASWGWPTVLRSSLGATYLIANYGVNGTTTTQQLAAWTATIRPIRYAKLFIAGGINDIRLNSPTLATTEANITQMVTEAQADGTTPYMMALLPCAGDTACNTYAANRVTYNTWLQGYAEAHGITWIDARTSMDDGAGALSTTACGGGTCDSGDYIHLSDAGQTYLSQHWQAAVQGTTCSEGAISSPCACGLRVIGVGYCCSGAWQAGAC